MVAPAYSPPAEKPCRQRKATNNTGAATPIEAAEGISPIAAVEPDISRTVTAKTRLRPTRSPSRPKNAPPSGRSANATAKTANVSRTPLAGLEEAKNVAAM